MTNFDDLTLLNDVLRAIYSADTADFPQVLDDLTAASARWVPGAQEAGITVTSRQNEVSTPSVTDDCARLLDEFQQRYLEGPCLHAAWTRKVVVVDDLRTDSRWPKYQADALARTPIRSILSLPMYAGELSMGALNFYAERPHAFSDDSRRMAALFATLGSLAWSNVVRTQQFKEALSTRDMIGQAKGILMERYELDDETAFNTLIKLSQSMNTPLRDIARRVIDDTTQR
ncbi:MULTISPECIES: GAF and ANTAR domain-containing protein [Mycobacterium avium complex (MAC)]|uniref:ANTAR domain-containing protein n=7 Tax=Mycobacterium avium complex (MAC) TaxID=120793 RepID=Q744F5_MYCPA|nr:MULTISPECIES: GAF and ANTAR domain-containing protein [Mycobacterium avium complex (MAC)]ETA91075.1 transcription antitermination regulator [Mycobacterium avium 05-4293]ETA94548.1 transcription antitermination regulator [Mycobacterium avium 10-5581]ETA97994.1 transcription antitermination regulator [Mycobacterium avium subsp. paratuberculosis 10-4404]ETB01125.1 transcription antitermination regulator [Mycobacterium avium subsp. paratuberculosis 10-5864]ETB06529.1 transcription antiterminati